MSGKKFVVKSEGTVDCWVRIRLSKEEVETIRKYFGKTDAIRFASSALYSQGYGWWHIYGDDERVDAALVGLRHCLLALTRKERPSLPQEAVVVSGLYVVRPRVLWGRKRPVAVSRKVQAELNRENEIRQEMIRLLSTKTMEQKLKDLQLKFG